MKKPLFEREIPNPELQEQHNKLHNDWKENEKQAITNSDKDFEQERCQDFEQELLQLSEKLGEEYNQYAQLIQNMAELKFSEEQLRFIFMEEAKDKGIKLITERKNYAKANLVNTQISKDRRALVKEATKIDWQIKADEMRFKALKTVMEFQTNVGRK